jgi:hypothetical protein
MSEGTSIADARCKKCFGVAGNQGDTYATSAEGVGFTITAATNVCSKQGYTYAVAEHRPSGCAENYARLAHKGREFPTSSCQICPAGTTIPARPYPDASSNEYFTTMSCTAQTPTPAPKKKAATACDASDAPTNGAVGTCTGSLAAGATCQPTCNAGYAAPSKSTCAHLSGTGGAFEYVFTSAICVANPTTEAAVKTVLAAVTKTVHRRKAEMRSMSVAEKKSYTKDLVKAQTSARASTMSGLLAGANVGAAAQEVISDDTTIKVQKVTGANVKGSTMTLTGGIEFKMPTTMSQINDGDETQIVAFETTEAYDDSSGGGWWQHRRWSGLLSTIRAVSRRPSVD